MLSCLRLLPLALVTLSLAAQTAPACHTPPPEAPFTAPENLPTPIRMTGIGNSHITITTSKPEAQQWFDQGLSLQHDFWDYEAAKAFQQSIRIDPDCAMCWWGLSEAISFRGDDNGEKIAIEDLKRAKKLSKHTTPSEKLFIEAAIESHKKHKDKNKKNNDERPTSHTDSKETKIYRKLVAINPAEIQPQIYLAGSLHDGYFHGDPNPGTQEAQNILHSLMQQHPDDPAVLHYWIHIIEPGNHPELARTAALKLGALTPASGHMVHMPGHIFYLLGEYDRAQDSFAASTRVDEAYMESQHVSPDDDWNYVHNLMYSIANLMEAGHFALADKLAQKTVAAHGTRSTTLYTSAPRDGMARLNPKLPAVLRAAQWKRAATLLAKSTAPAEYINLHLLRDALLQYAQGMAALDKGDITAAASAESSMKKLLDADTETHEAHKTPPAMHSGSTTKHDPRDAMHHPITSYLSLAHLELLASLQQAQGKTQESADSFKRALDQEARIQYREPPLYLRPVAEAQGDALFRAHNYAEAKKAYQAAQKKRPNSGFSLYGIAQCDEALNDVGTSIAYQNFLDAWGTADQNLPQIQHAQQWLTKHTAPANGM